MSDYLVMCLWRDINFISGNCLWIHYDYILTTEAAAQYVCLIERIYDEFCQFIDPTLNPNFNRGISR